MVWPVRPLETTLGFPWTKTEFPSGVIPSYIDVSKLRREFESEFRQKFFQVHHVLKWFSSFPNTSKFGKTFLNWIWPKKSLLLFLLFWFCQVQPELALLQVTQKQEWSYAVHANFFFFFCHFRKFWIFPCWVHQPAHIKSAFGEGRGLTQHG